jgi:hypothetical protein
MLHSALEEASTAHGAGKLGLERAIANAAFRVVASENSRVAWQVAVLLSLSSKCDRGRRKVTAEPLTVHGLKT